MKRAVRSHAPPVSLPVAGLSSYATAVMAAFEKAQLKKSEWLPKLAGLDQRQLRELLDSMSQNK